MTDTTEPNLEIPEDATSLEVSAIVVPAAYIDRATDTPLSECLRGGSLYRNHTNSNIGYLCTGEASHEFTTTQVDAIIERGLSGLPVTLEHCDDEEIMSQVLWLLASGEI